MKKLLIVGVLIVIGVLGYTYFQRVSQPSGSVLTPIPSPTSRPLYQIGENFKASIRIFDENVAQVSHLEMTPDYNYLLVATLPGKIWVYHKVNRIWQKQVEPFFEVNTAQPGWPPQEAGLTGMALGADFTTSGDVFLLYSFAFEKKSFRNRVTRVTFTKSGQKVIGTDPVQIFEANTPGTGSHQIQDGVGVTVGGKPHLLFNLGEGFVGERALDPKLEAGKVMLIGRDGGAPVGQRPWPESPKVQTIGIRNPPAIARSPKNGKIMIGDTGPNNYDRLLYGILYDTEGNNDRGVSFNWTGKEESLTLSAADLYDGQKNMNLYQWAPTETPVNILFYENEKLPTLRVDQQYILVSLFGKSGEPGNTPGKKILLGKLTEGEKNTVAFQTLIERTTEAAEVLSHPLGLAVDQSTGTIFFGDILAGTMYQIELE